MTGMPGFEKALSTTQMWQVSLLCANADKLPGSVKQTLTSVTPVLLKTAVSPAATGAAAGLQLLSVL